MPQYKIEGLWLKKIDTGYSWLESFLYYILYMFCLVRQLLKIYTLKVAKIKAFRVDKNIYL